VCRERRAASAVARSWRQCMMHIVHIFASAKPPPPWSNYDAGECNSSDSGAVATAERRLPIAPTGERRVSCGDSPLGLTRGGGSRLARVGRRPQTFLGTPWSRFGVGEHRAPPAPRRPLTDDAGRALCGAQYRPSFVGTPNGKMKIRMTVEPQPVAGCLPVTGQRS
jgi:hypothetical protein